MSLLVDPSQDPPKMIPPRPEDEMLPSEVHPNCSYYIKASNGSFSSPNYPNHYRDNITCGWMIQAPRGYSLHIRFAEINLDR